MKKIIIQWFSLLSILLALSLSNCTGDKPQEHNEATCCTKSCQKGCHTTCEAKQHACALDVNDHSCCVDADEKPLKKCCKGEMKTKTCCKKKTV